MRFSRSVLIEALAYTLYKWLGVQGIWRASQTVVLPCSFSTALILFPICTSLTFDIKNAWNCVSCLKSRVSTPHLSNKSFHAVANTAFNNSSLTDCPHKEDRWKFGLQGQLKTLSINMFGYVVFAFLHVCNNLLLYSGAKI